jgi:hypothetical protein
MSLKRGRPRVDVSDQSVTVTVTLPARQYDRICTLARQASLSVPEVIRRRLEDKQPKNRPIGQ